MDIYIWGSVQQLLIKFLPLQQSDLMYSSGQTPHRDSSFTLIYSVLTSRWSVQVDFSPAMYTICSTVDAAAFLTHPVSRGLKRSSIHTCFGRRTPTTVFAAGLLAHPPSTARAFFFQTSFNSDGGVAPTWLYRSAIMSADAQQHLPVSATDIQPVGSPFTCHVVRCGILMSATSRCRANNGHRWVRHHHAQLAKLVRFLHGGVAGIHAAVGFMQCRAMMTPQCPVMILAQFICL